MAEHPQRLSYLQDTDQIVHDGIPRDIECKFLDTDFNQSVNSSADIIAQCNLIPQGVTESTRIGEHVVVKSIQVQGRCTYSGNPASSGAVYMWLVLDKQANQSLFQITDVWKTDNLSLTLRNMHNMSRFVLLQGWLFQMTNVAVSQDIVVNINWVAGVDIPIDFDGTEGDLDEISNNNVTLVAGTDAGTFSGAAVRGTVRIRYTDN